MSDKLREAVEALPRIRLTGEQLDDIDPDPEKHYWVDWDEHADFVSLGDLRAALAQPSEPGLDEWGSDLDVAEYAVWYARKRKGPAREVAQHLLDEYPPMRFSERARLANGGTK